MDLAADGGNGSGDQCDARGSSVRVAPFKRQAADHRDRFASACGGYRGSFREPLQYRHLNALLAGISVSVTLYTVLVTMALESAPPARLRVLAARHDAPGVFVLIAGLMIDFAALGLIIRLLMSKHVGGAKLILAAAAISAAWALLNMLFAIHYAHVLFGAGDKPPLDVPGEGDADRRFSDFIDFSFVTGMAFQVSDVFILENGMRRPALAQSVLAFLFNVFVRALSVNAIGNLL